MASKHEEIRSEYVRIDGDLYSVVLGYQNDYCYVGRTWRLFKGYCLSVTPAGPIEHRDGYDVHTSYPQGGRTFYFNELSGRRSKKTDAEAIEEAGRILSSLGSKLVSYSPGTRSNNRRYRPW